MAVASESLVGTLRQFADEDLIESAGDEGRMAGTGKSFAPRVRMLDGGQGGR